MLVDNVIYKNKYKGNGSTTAFPISFPFLDNSHIKVLKSIDGSEDEVVPKSEYIVTGAGVEKGGTCTFKTAPAAGTIIVISRDIPITQMYAYNELDNFPAKSHEDALAKLTMIAQELKEQLNRALIVPSTSDKTPQQVLTEILEIAELANEYAIKAEEIYNEVVVISSHIDDVKQSIDTSKQSIDESEANVTALAGQVLEYSDELELVATHINGIEAIENNTDAISAIAADLQGYPIYEFDGGLITEPNQSMNGIGGVMKICADNIEDIKKVAESLRESAALAALAEDVTEIGKTDYVTIVNTGNSEPNNE